MWFFEHVKISRDCLRNYSQSLGHWYCKEKKQFGNGFCSMPKRNDFKKIIRPSS